MRETLALTERRGLPQPPGLDARDGRPSSGLGCPIEEIAQAYLQTSQGDPDIALRCAITDALSDLLEAERRARENSRLILRGYVRNGAGQG